MTVELERRWNAALDSVRAIEQRIAGAAAARERMAARAPDAGTYLELASDLNRVWSAPSTDWTLKKRIVRAVVEQVWADLDPTRSEVVLVVHWKGGAHTDLRIAKRKTGVHRRTTAIEVVDAVRALAPLMRDEQIARWLGRAGLRTPTGAHYTRALVASVRHLRGIEAYAEHERDDAWLTCEEAAALVGVDPKTMRRAAQRGELAAIHPLPGGPWIFARADLVGDAARRIAERAHAHREGRNAGPTADQLSLEIPRT